jgi:hypothetical protein
MEANYNRPLPQLDYAPQEIGTDDTRYDFLTTADCRDCHGDSLADRHHYTSVELAHELGQ